jgi:hypothetical protein
MQTTNESSAQHPALESATSESEQQQMKDEIDRLKSLLRVKEIELEFAKASNQGAKFKESEHQIPLLTLRLSA